LWAVELLHAFVAVPLGDKSGKNDASVERK
jgi:hypothetical protein